ncbi:MAG: matrixin family metalloprotease [Phycisphaerae bacterium]|nr:matrixin family metalloprotease [Phycisphaerae bacterium]
MHPRQPLGALRAVTITSFTLTLALILGCGSSPILGTGSLPATPPDQASGGPTSGQSAIAEGPSENSAFGGAEPATMPLTGEIVIEGTIDAIDDVDIYALGSALAGDRVVIDVTGNNGLNTVAALFDGYQDLIDANDDRSYYAGNIDPYIARVVRQDAANLYVGIAVSRATHFAHDNGRYDNGTYTVRITREQGFDVPVARHQLVYLDFEGGDRVQIGLEPFETMRSFSAESISGRFAGQTDYVVGLILEHMRRDYARFNVTLLDSKHHDVPTEVHSTLYFGNYNASYLGLADNVDTGNAYLEQEAIIYTEDLALFEGLVPSAEETALALANIASHELGHLLGLEHSAEAQDIMSTAATARQILETDADFGRRGLDDRVFPAGWQNDPQLLWQNVGASIAGVSNARLRLEDILPKASPSWRDKLDDIPIVQCGRCGGHCGSH